MALPPHLLIFHPVFYIFKLRRYILDQSHITNYEVIELEPNLLYLQVNNHASSNSLVLIEEDRKLVMLGISPCLMGKRDIAEHNFSLLSMYVIIGFNVTADSWLLHIEDSIHCALLLAVLNLVFTPIPSSLVEISGSQLKEQHQKVSAYDKLDNAFPNMKFVHISLNKQYRT